ncbi:MAG: hypothetical protein ACI9US_004113 [Gammaproteobacteria bacterium]|jgi:hypothetical protein
METMQQNMNEQMKKFADMQAKSLEPMRVFSALAAEAGEQMMRQNHAVLGDFVDFAVKQANVPFNPEAVSEATTAQVADAMAFGELLGARASEYAEMVNEIGQKTQKAATEIVAASKAV